VKANRVLRVLINDGCLPTSCVGSCYSLYSSRFVRADDAKEREVDPALGKSDNPPIPRAIVPRVKGVLLARVEAHRNA
jgi:hypothetical protein